MSDFAKVIKDEIARVARREIRKSTAILKSDNVKLKKLVAGLKRQVAVLERESRMLSAAEKRLREQGSLTKSGSDELERFKISSKGIRSLRRKLRLSQADFAELVGVSAQAVYIWENRDGSLNLRDNSRLAIMELRQIGAREARRRLEETA